MTEISATMVKELREATNVGMMECKKALVEAGGDRERAIVLLRERGLATAAKKSVRAANSGLLAARTADDGQTGVLVEVNCETDFVARNEVFQAFVQTVLDRALTVKGDLGESMKSETAAKIAEIGENLIVRRGLRFNAEGQGAVGVYIHLGSKVGVMIEVSCEKPETRRTEAFQTLIRDLTLHIAACSPGYLDRAAVPKSLLASEGEIFAKQVEGKPTNIVEKIVAGKIEKMYSQICLVEQGFVKDPDTRVDALVAATGKTLGDTLAIRRFVRWQLGESI
ncbi:MAG: translation elongation factor Ts [Kiritimatiellia bacterium]|nr:translation elongation factor Ts [Kiritimatiellia bacterium]